MKENTLVAPQAQQSIEVLDALLQASSSLSNTSLGQQCADRFVTGLAAGALHHRAVNQRDWSWLAAALRRSRCSAAPEG